jgi:hypothetical protein
MPVIPPDTHEDNMHNAENKVRVCHVFAAAEELQPDATNTVLKLDEILTKLRQGSITQDQANQQLSEISLNYFKLEETKGAFAEAVEAIKKYTAD